MINIDTSTPVILLGGRENTVAVARNLGKLGVHVTVCGEAGCRALVSRYCDKAVTIPAGETTHGFWGKLLLSDEAEKYKGHIIFAFCDDSLEFIETNHEALRERYLLEDFVPDLRRAMLDKQETLSLARAANVPIPNFWPINTDADVHAIKDELRFPVMVKPLNSYAFVHEFGTKLFIIEDDFDEVAQKVALARAHGQDVMVVEMVPGPDTLLSSYYTYMDQTGQTLFKFTKAVLRRWPVNRGGGCYHITRWEPETAELGQRLFDAIGWRGLANIEFKRDTRDGQLKVIEVNSRFTAAHRLVTASGAPIDLIIYCHLTGQDGPQFETFTEGMRLWYPLRDFFAYLEMRQTGDLTFAGWIKSISHKKILPYFSFADPMPSFAEGAADIGRMAKRVFGRSRKAGS